MLTGWPKKYQKYIIAGGYFTETGELVYADGLHVIPTAPEKVKEYFRRRNEGCIKTGWEPPFIIH